MKKAIKYCRRKYATQKFILFSDLPHQIDFHAWLPSLMFLIGLGTLSTLFFSFALSSIGFSFHIPITKYHLLLAFCFTNITLLLCALSDHKKGIIPALFISVVIVFGVVLSSIQLSKQFFDLNYDSQWYHLEAIIALGNGWNPVQHLLTEQANPDISSQNILNSYQKAQEIAGTVIYKATNSIESAKSVNIISIIMAFSFVLGCLLQIKKLHPIIAFMGTILLISNPITLNQYFSMYIDGAMYNFILSFAALLVLFYMTHKNTIYIPMIFCISFLWNIKLPGIFFAGSFLAAFLVYTWYKEKVLLFFKSIQIFIFSSFIGVFILGFHPYVTNTIWYGNPLYLDDGKGAESFLYINTPASFYYISSPERFILSIFSKPQIIRGEGKTHQLKFPFTYTEDELKWLISDNTTGGFGSLFSGVFIISIIGLLYMFRSRHIKHIKYGVILYLFTLLFTSMYFPVSSYARFITPFWMFPCIIAIYTLSEKKVLSKLIGVTLLTVMIANNYLITKEYLTFNINGTQSVKSELEVIKKLSENEKVRTDFDLFRSNRIRFQEAGIAFIERSPELCIFENQRVLVDYIPESKITICQQVQITK